MNTLRNTLHTSGVRMLLLSLLLLLSVHLSAVNAPVPDEAERVELGIRSFQLKSLREGAWRVYTNKQEPQGYLINTKAFAEDVSGFQGSTPLFVYFDEKGVVKAVVAQPNSETPDLFNRAETLLSAYVGRTAQEGLQARPDAVSGATLSSRSLMGNMQAACKVYGELTRSSNLMGQVGTVLLVLALVLGVVVVFWTRRRRTPSCCR